MQIMGIVLIDTWWNVNKTYEKVFVIPYEVLIDTWWNVNSLDDLLKEDEKEGFNRYMVECK